jgi:glycine cleavage system H lipoate-binding protein
MTVLFVIATIVILLGIDWFVQRAQTRRQAQQAGELRPVAASRSEHGYPIRLPQGIFFTPSHTWINLFPSGKVRLGIDDFILHLLDAPSIALLKSPGEHVHTGDPLFRLDQDGHSLTVYAPFDADVLASNHRLAENPSLVKDNLFSEGWGYLLKPHHPSVVKQFLLGKETSAWIRNEFQKLKDLFAAAAARSGHAELAPALLLQDGGLPLPGMMNTLDDKIWQSIENEFLYVPSKEGM